MRKVKAGASSAITQYFFNADAYFYFVERVAKLGVDIPVVPGIMPITNYSKLARFSDACGANYRAGSASNWKPTATTAAASRPSASRSSARCANACWRAAHRDCISIL